MVYANDILLNNFVNRYSLCVTTVDINVFTFNFIGETCLSLNPISLKELFFFSLMMCTKEAIIFLLSSYTHLRRFKKEKKPPDKI